MTYFNFKAIPVPADAREGVTENERRFRAELEEAMRRGDIAISAIYNAIDEGLGANAYYIRTTDDAGDGTLAGDANATDYTGQDSTVDQCVDVAADGSVYYFVHKDQVYLFTGTRPRRFGAGCPDTVVEDDFTPFGGLVDWVDIINKPATFPPSPHTHVEEDITDLDRTRWRGNWVNGATYFTSDMCLDNPYLMVANKETTDRPGPTNVGDPFDDLPAAPAWDADGTYTGVVWTGVEYTITQATQINSYDVWVPELTGDTNYTIRLYSHPVGLPEDIIYQQLPEPILTENAWTTVTINPTLFTAGTVLGIVIDALNSGDSAQPGGTPADWNRQGDDNNNPPTTGGWNRNNNATTLRIHAVTADAATIDMNGVTAGSTFQFVSTDDPTQSVTYAATTGETYDGASNSYSWGMVQDAVGPGGAPPVGQRCLVTIDVPVPSPTKYKVDADGNAARVLPAGTTSIGLRREDGAITVLNAAAAYGVRANFQEVSLSPDWDYMAGLGSGGGGSSGSTNFLPLTGGVMQGGIVMDGNAIYDANPLTSNYIKVSQPAGGGATVALETVLADSSRFEFQVDGVERWRIVREGNAPHNIKFISRDHNGLNPETALDIQRGNGEFHDPTGGASWRIIGNTLECWGAATTAASGAVTVVFPKTFARTPAVTTAGNQTSGAPRIVGYGNIDANGVQVWCHDTAGQASQRGVRWHAIGEWDGVS